MQAPRLDPKKLRAQVAARFPNYGLYRAPGVEPEDEFLLGDAIDDLGDIAIDLAEVAWLWENAGESAALWQFFFGFESHWGSHLRNLQWYVHEMARRGSEGRRNR